MKFIDDDKSMNPKPLACWIQAGILAALTASAGSIHAQVPPHDDSVTSGKSKGAFKIVITTPQNPTLDDTVVNFLLKEQLMQSAGADLTTFGPFTNNSKVALHITLHHRGQSKNRQSQTFLNGVFMDHGQETSTLVVPPGNTYSWDVQDGYAISAWVPAKGVYLQDVGLPSADDFANPKPKGAYVGCLYMVVANETESDSGRTVSYSLVGPAYLYDMSNGISMSDGSDPSEGNRQSAYRYGTVSAPEFGGGGIFFSGPAPASPGTCIKQAIPLPISWPFP